MINIKSKDEVERIRECGIISSKLFKYLKKYIDIGITTKELDKISEDYIKKNNAEPSFKGYHGYPCSICASVNNEIIHGIPCKMKLKDGDIIGIDVGILKKGFISDSAYTFQVGNVKQEKKLLVERTETSLYKAIYQIKNNVEINAIGGTVEDYINQFNYGIVRDYCGHGVGYKNHEDPEIPNYRVPYGKRKLRTNTVIAIEPMINLGKSTTYVLEDGWTVVTSDGECSAHFEHTVCITETGYDILTIEPEDLNIIKKKFNI